MLPCTGLKKVKLEVFLSAEELMNKAKGFYAIKISLLEYHENASLLYVCETKQNCSRDFRTSTA